MRLLGYVLLFAMLFASPAVAQAEAVADPRDEEARSLFEAGRIAFLDGRFEDARAHFLRSYELSHRPELLYNIASADDRLRNDEAAARGFEQYLAEVPDAENRVEVEGRLEALHAAIAARSAPEPTPVEGPSVIWTWVTAGAAVVTGGLAIGFWVAANDQYAGLESGCFSRGGCSDEAIAGSGVETSLTLTNVFLVSSLVLTAATAVILPIELTRPGSSGSSDTPSAQLRVGPGSLSITGSF